MLVEQDTMELKCVNNDMMYGYGYKYFLYIVLEKASYVLYSIVDLGVKVEEQRWRGERERTVE